MNRWAATVIGLGQIGLMYDFDPKRERPSSHVLAYELNNQIDLVGATDIKHEAKLLLAKIAPEAEFYSSAEILLEEKKPDIVSICTPPWCHLSDIKKVLVSTKPKVIFCEKPIAQNIKDAMEIRSCLEQNNTLLIPNISRRWNSGMIQVKKCIEEKKYGDLKKIHIRYTRGIYNTGAHLFDLLKMWTGNSIKKVQALKKIYTTSEDEGELSFSFYFQQENDVDGFAEAFDDTQYYIFEIDLFFSNGKIEFRNSGDDIFYYGIATHHLFSGFQELVLEKHEKNLLKESCLKNAINNIVNVLNEKEKPNCIIDDAIYPLYVAGALMKSYKNKKTERVDYDDEISVIGR